MENRCISCGEVIPEGRMVCQICEFNCKIYGDELVNSVIDNIQLEPANYTVEMGGVSNV